MKGLKLTKDSRLCFLSIVLTVLMFVGEKAYEIFMPQTKTAAIVIAMLSTALLLFVFWVVNRSEDVFFGLLAALIGFKMLPVYIPFLWSGSLDAYILYFTVGKLSMFIFALIAYKLFRKQPHPREIKPVAILAIMLAVPFFNQISAEYTSYFLTKTGSMLLGYFSQFACYIAASLIILIAGYITSYRSLQLAVCFEYIALAINIMKRVGRISYNLAIGEHVSKSLYIWLVIYAALLFAAAFSLKLKAKHQTQE